jgi:hypothetical protein
VNRGPKHGLCHRTDDVTIKGNGQTTTDHELCHRTDDVTIKGNGSANEQQDPPPLLQMDHWDAATLKAVQCCITFDGCGAERSVFGRNLHGGCHWIPHLCSG